jgi:hypothetical protein
MAAHEILTMSEDAEIEPGRIRYSAALPQNHADPKHFIVRFFFYLCETHSFVVSRQIQLLAFFGKYIVFVYNLLSVNLGLNLRKFKKNFVSVLLFI